MLVKDISLFINHGENMYKRIIPLLLILCGTPSHSAASTDTDDLKCISVLSYFSQRIDNSVPNVSSKLPNAIIGKINGNRALAGKKSIESNKHASYSDEGLKSCLAIGVKTSTLLMIVNATEGKQYSVPIERYEKCGEGMLTIAAYYRKSTSIKKGDEMIYKIGFQLGQAEKELRYLYPVFDKKINYSLVETVTNNIKQHRKSKIKNLILSCKTTGLEYKMYLDALLKAQENKPST